jgi:hypothetical protein
MMPLEWFKNREISFESFSLTGFPFCKTLFELEHEVGILGPVFSSLQPNFKPSINSCNDAHSGKMQI